MAEKWIKVVTKICFFLHPQKIIIISHLVAPQSYTNSPSGIIHLMMLLDVGVDDVVVDVGDIGVGVLYYVNVVVVDNDGFTC